MRERRRNEGDGLDGPLSITSVSTRLRERRRFALEPLAEPRTDLGDVDRIGRVGMAARERRRRIVLEPELDALGDVVAGELARHREAEIDPGGHAARGDAVPIANDASSTESGFSGTAHMNRAFMRELGMTPRTYRALHARA